MNRAAATLSNPNLRTPLDSEEIQAQLDVCLEVEFSFLHVEDLAQTLAGMPREQQEFVLQWTRRVASTNIQLAFEFASRAEAALALMDRELISLTIETWQPYYEARITEEDALEIILSIARMSEGWRYS